MNSRVTDAADVDPRPLGKILVGVFVGGMIGTAARLALSLLNDGIPWGILIANLAGALLLGFLFERVREHRIRGSETWAVLGPGLCGALTTFSALQMDAIELARDGQVLVAVAYLVASVALGVPIAAVGRWIGRGAL